MRPTGTKITDAALPALGTLSNLISLGLSRTAIGDAGLASLKGMPKLRSLDLSYTNVTDAGLEQLHGSTLYILNLKGTTVSAEGVAELQRSMRGRVMGP